ncbi:hypothetical protein F4054_00935 [Candidatus Poribacteria bacterium]|nr:hypothetical protein [Candidatus Poribacteria bacterium]MYG05562.1 hypothetical protein [Candidatus Poribacteria bacterium]MYK20805.1 hypothetical protein [Candidatus Poribacteria bacterium]
MAFSDFKAIPDVQEKFKITYATDDLLGTEEIVNPSDQFLSELEFSIKYIDVYASEGARCENVIYPILREVYKGYADTYALWVKKPLTYDDTLSGTPDYFISTRSELGILTVGTPLIILVEAKKNDFEQGWGQCLAELVAAQKINDDPDTPVYGIVSDGERWQFGKLTGDAFTRHKTSFSIDNIPTLFGAINTVFKAARTAPVEQS